MERILVVDVMTRDPVTVKPGTNLLDCAKKMVKKKIGSLLITNDKKELIGIITQKDILWALIKKSKEDLSAIKVEDISPKKIMRIKPEVNLRDAVERMKKLKVKKLPVVKDKELLGIVTVRDILNFHPEFYKELEEFEKIKEESEKLRRIKEAQKRDIVRYGICEKCGHKGLLHKFNGMLLCSSCKDSV